MKTIKETKRFDNIDRSEWMTTKFSRTAEGFLKGRAIVTCAGVFTYQRADGSIQRELRLPEEVFAPETLESLKLKPVTLNHPMELVTSQNADELQVGSLGDNPSRTTQERDWEGRFIDFEKLTDGLNCAIDMIITKEDAINEVINGKQGLSMGYTCDLEESSGTWCGVDYDCIQRNIRYNHCAIVDVGRAGGNAKIDLRMDSADAVLKDILLVTNDGGTKMKKIKLDGIEYEAEETVIKALNSEKTRADNAESELNKLKEDSKNEISVLTADRDTQKERADKAEEELKTLKETSMDKTKLDEAVKAKMELLHNAEMAGVEVKGDESDADLKKSIIKKVFPKANLDGKDEVYIQARYDGAIENLSDEADAKSRQALAGDISNSSATKNDSSDVAREKMIARMKNHGKEV